MYLFDPLVQLVLLLLAACFPLEALSISLAKYPEGPVELSPVASLWYDIDVSSDTARFALVVKDKNFVKNGSNWIGFGIGEPTSGSMLGADIVTAEFAAGENEKCKVVDRYVPWAAYPLLEEPSVFPVPDDCQTDKSWVLVQCARDTLSGEMVLEVTRSLKAHDTQDRAIGFGPQIVIHAYGVDFQYHSGARGSRSLTLYSKSGDIVPAMGAEMPLPSDVSANQSMVASDYNVPADRVTTYACTGFIGDTGPQKRRMIVAADAVLKSKAGKNVVHHLIVYLCEDSSFFRKYLGKTAKCSLDGEASPLGNAEAKCSNFAFVWAVGEDRFVYPREAGMLLTERNKFIVIETHYDNADMADDIVDQSGARLYYADELREHEAGVLATGDALVSRFGTTVKSDFEYEHTCPSACTKLFPGKMNVFGSFLHMHTTGKEIYTNKYSENGTFIQQSNAVKYWSNDHQVTRRLDPPLIISPGESLRHTCVFDTSKRPDTKFGAETLDEMCLEFMFYWPLYRRTDTNDTIYYCSYFLPQNATEGITLCGDASKVQEAILEVANPVAPDKVGAPDDFGAEVKTCSAVESSAGPEATTAPNESVPAPTEGADVTAGAGVPSEDDGSPTGTSSSNLEDDDNTCFPAAATVQLEDGTTKTMSDLQVGDLVLVAPGQFSRVFMFTHRLTDGDFSFVRLHTSGGQDIVVTSNHYLYVNGKLSIAGSVQCGDLLRLGSGKMMAVSRTSHEIHAGLYNPQTVHGDIVVNGVHASTYTRSVAPKAAHALLVPFRWAFSRVGVSTDMFDDGARFLSSVMSAVFSVQ